MGMFSFLQKGSITSGNALPEIFPFQILQNKFVEADVSSTFVKILTDTIERTSGLPKKYEPLLWDNCVQNEATKGLISHLADAMTCQKDIYLVYVSAVNVLREATREEEEKIKADYEKRGESKVGVYISFKKYSKSEMLKIYSAFEHCVLASLHKTLNLSKAVQIKVSELRSSVALMDSSVAMDQARSMADALACGKDILLDVKDMIETATPDTSTTEKAIAFLEAKKAFILGLPTSYISGLQTTGIGSTGEADMRAVERGLKNYFVSIIRPTLKALFGVDVEFKTQDFRQMASALEILKTFELVDNNLISFESKQELISRMFDLDVDEEKKNIKKELKTSEANSNANTQAPNSDNQNQNTQGSRFA